jgi:hypothetical protein
VVSTYGSGRFGIQATKIHVIALAELVVAHLAQLWIGFGMAFARKHGR